MTNGWLMKNVRETLVKMGFRGWKSLSRQAAAEHVRNSSTRKSGGYDHPYRESRTFSGDISQVRVSGPIDLMIIQDGDCPSLTVYGADAEQVAEISTVTERSAMVIKRAGLEVSAGLVDLSMRGGAVVIDNMTVHFGDDRVTTEVRGVHVVGGQTGEGRTKAKPRPLVELVLPEIPAIRASGASNIDLKVLEAHRVPIVLADACNLTARGHVDAFDLRVSGAGTADTSHLVAKRVSLEVSGAAIVGVRATEALDAAVSGAAMVTVYGNPAERRADIAGAGRVHYGK
ncbi:GIN domain-containing protein [Rhodanobacter sp. FW106-PBR-LB-2-11]|uniref:GIN domain-containing protein n=1 Tax=Rhodanobacter sp. FW106-PBR-LB-2-11 TaxID=1524463 RepID=UPI0034E4AD8B